MLTDIRLQNFRSYTDSAFEFSDRVNIVVGPNASGKTNLLEAILVVATSKSYRAKDQELIKFGAEWARLDAHQNNNNLRTIKLSTEPSAASPKYEISGKAYNRLPQTAQLPAVVFEPNHLQLLNSEPKLRREYMDNVLGVVSLDYRRNLARYKRTLAQRNALLKNPGGDKSQLFAWDVRLCELGGKLALSRYELITKYNEKLPDIYKKISKSNNEISLRYETSYPIHNYSSAMLKTLETNHELDTMRGFTSAGPHRDDLIVEFDGHNAQDSASRGEVRTLLLTLKILELEHAEDYFETKPILLLDDVFSELDGARRKALTGFLKKYQTFITTTDADIVVQHFMDKCNIIPTT